MVNGTPAVGADSFITRMSPNLAQGDVMILSIAISPSNAMLGVRPNGTYYANVNGSLVPQTLQADAYSRTLGLYGEGTLVINDRAPVPTNGHDFLGNTTFALGAPVSLQLQATDPDNNPIKWTIQSGVFPPGLSLGLNTGLVTGTPTTLGSFGFVIRVTDPFGAFTDVADSAIVSSVLPNFVGQQLSVATLAVQALGLTVFSSQTGSGLTLNQIITQSPPANTPITSGTTVVTFIVSDGSGFVGLTTLFPNNILGLTWNGTRETDFTSTYQEAITGKVSSATYTKYPTTMWDLNYELLNQAAAQDDLKKIMGLFNQQQAQAINFLYQDPAFNSVANEVFFIGDGIKKQAQLTAQYRVPGGPGLAEKIQALNPTVLFVMKDLTAGITLVNGVDYFVGATGNITFPVAPALNHQIAWTGSFYYICKFVTDNIDPEQFMQNFWQMQSISFRSVII